jgi:hypothetical protein
MDRQFTSPTHFDYLWLLKTKAATAVVANQKQIPRETFAKKLKEVKLSMRRGHLLTIKW